MSFDRAARHTRLVRRLRWMLPVLALFLSLFYAGLSYIHSLLARIDLGPLQMTGTSLVLQNPRLQGYDKYQRPYDVTAKSATQSITDTKQVELQGIEANMDNGWAKLSSAHGILNTESERVDLDGGVNVTSSQGYELQLQSVRIDAKDGTMTSDKPVVARQGRNTISADRMSVTQSGALIRLEGHVRVELHEGAGLKVAP